MKFVKRLRVARLGIMLLSVFTLAPAFAQQVDIGPFLELLAPVPLSTQFVLPNAVAENVDLRFNAAVYPIPLLLQRELNLDVGMNVTYSVGQAPLLVYLGAGPRYSLVNSDWLPGTGAVGSYVGAGAAVGLELGSDFLGVALEGGGDALFGITEGSTTFQLVPRVNVGLNLPIIGTVAPF